MAGNLQPLDEKFAIVEPDGRPTLYFIKWAQQKQIDIQGAITEEQFNELLLEYLLAHQLQEGSGIQITPNGNISNSPTIAADVQEILDQITITRGSILYRNASDWVALAPGTAGFLLQTNGAGADPAWVAPGGAGGSWTQVGVAVAGNAFIDVLLDADNGFAYEFMVDGNPSVDITGISMRFSNDNGASFFAGANDYKTGTGTTAAQIAIAGAIGTGRHTMSRGSITGMNVATTDRFRVNGTFQAITSAGAHSTGTFGGAVNSLGSLNYNAFRIFVNAGNMNTFKVYWKRMYP